MGEPELRELDALAELLRKPDENGEQIVPWGGSLDKNGINGMTCCV